MDNGETRGHGHTEAGVEEGLRAWMPEKGCGMGTWGMGGRVEPIDCVTLVTLAIKIKFDRFTCMAGLYSAASSITYHLSNAHLCIRTHTTLPRCPCRPQSLRS